MNLPYIIDIIAIEKTIATINAAAPTLAELKLALSVIDLTSLEGNNTTQDIITLCDKAIKNNMAAVCVYPVFISTAKNKLKNSATKVAAVAGAFPSGQLPLPLRLTEVTYAIDEGADEIDMVLSRGKFLEKQYDFVFDEIAAFKQLCGNKTLKVILETGEFKTLDNISMASNIALRAGADFIKTSTGKISVNATLPATYVMLQAIKEFYTTTGKKCGIKPSGGIADSSLAIHYLRLTQIILGNDWLQPSLFRFGASRLADNLIAEIQNIGNELNA